jgi:hypothetical protein
MSDLEIALTALRRIRSLAEKNVPKYAQQIASEALKLIEEIRVTHSRRHPE